MTNLINTLDRYDGAGWYKINGKLVKNRCYYIINTEEIVYTPIDPQPDSDIICQFPRLMLIHMHDGYMTIKVVDSQEMTAGWVIGLVLGKNDI